MITTEAPADTTSASGKHRWFQLGLVSAGAAAPLIARWRSLRAEEQAEALREQAVARWNETIARIAASGRPEVLQEALRHMAPQAQEALRQALPQAQESFRQVSAAARDALQRFPGASQAPAMPEAPVIPTTPATRRVSATLWLAGVGVGVVAAGAIAYIILRNRMGAATDDDALVEIPLTVVTTPADVAASASAEAAEGPAIVQEPPEEEPGIAEPTDFSDADVEGAAFVGNIHSRVYHAADSSHLPAPQHRIYFTTEAEAVAMGYRPDSNEFTAPSTDVSGQRD